MSLETLRRENESLRAQLVERDAMIADRDAKIERLAQDVATLQAVVERLLATRKREDLVPEGQGVLFPEAVISEEGDDSEESSDAGEEEEGEDPEPEPPKPRSKRGKRRIDTSGMRREEVVHELPEEERICPETGMALVPIGEKIFEEIDYKRAEVTLVRHRTVVYGVSTEQSETRKVAPLVAPMPPRPLENCAASAGLLAWLLVQKYANHLPLYRQEKIFERDGLLLPRQTLCDWVLRAAEALQPIADYLMSKVRAGPVLQLDDTPVMCQGGRGENHFKAYLWTFVNPEIDGVVYRFTSGRTGTEVARNLVGFKGTLVGDGYAGNRAAANIVNDQIKHAGCWAHVTRKFRDAIVEAPGSGRLFCDDIKLLYEIESEADELELAAPARQALRYEKSRPIVIKMLIRARRLRDQYSDAGLISKAIGYLNNQRRWLRQFLRDGRVPIDNNACERSIRTIAIGRRNWLFLGSMRGGRAAAVIFTLIECCRLAKVDPVEYLGDVLVRVATHPASQIDALLPVKWSATVTADRPAAALALT